MPSPVDRLIFVFHADSGRLAAFLDSVKKVLAVESCTLCAITHGLAGEKSDWKSCRESLGIPVDYLHLDEIPAHLKEVVGGATPCVIAEAGGSYVRLLEPDVLAQCQGDVGAFKRRLAEAAAAHDLALPALL